MAKPNKNFETVILVFCFVFIYKVDRYKPQKENEN